MKRKRGFFIAAMALTVVGSLCSGQFAAADEAAEQSYVLSKDGPLVQTEGGQALGFVEDGVYTFLGIPYAKAERWEMPEKADPWEGTLNCLRFREICEQGPVDNGASFFNGRPLAMEAESEDCQFLNIWSNDISPNAKKPVMVFLHGGGFSTGSATQSVNHNGHGLTAYGDVVTVSLNHRINVLGYLDLSAYGEEYENSGNLGMADIVMALQWVHDNIEQFGGDPGNVTIFGQSGGGAKVLTLMALPAAEGLFQKAICESASSRFATREDAQLVAAELMKRLGTETVDELKEVDYDTLLATADGVISELNENGEIAHSAWMPVAGGSYYPEGYTDLSTFIDSAKDIPLMIGTTFGEMSSNALPAINNYGPIFYTGDLTEEDVLERLTVSYGDKAADIIAAFKEAYPTHPVQDVLFIGMRGWSPEQYCGAYSIDNVVALAKANQNGAPVYAYVFAYRYPTYGGLTATHGAELAFVFHAVEDNRVLMGDDPAAYALQDQVCQAWANFAKTGDPSQDGLEWEPFTAESGMTMVFDETSECRAFHDKALMDLMIQTNN